MTRLLAGREELDYATTLRTWRERRHLSKKALAEAISYDPSRVSHIEAGRQPPTEEFTRQAETVLQTGGALWECWEAIAAERFIPTPRRPERNLRTADLIGWLANISRLPFETVYSAVNDSAARLEAEAPSARHALAHARRQITRTQVADTVRRYYGHPHDGHHFYTAAIGDVLIRLSILTQPDWLRHRSSIEAVDEATSYNATATAIPELDDITLTAAVRRLAAAELAGTVIVNNQLYRLLHVASTGAALSASFGLSDFATYALTTDLLEDELLGVLTPNLARPNRRPGGMPLRDALLHDTRAATTLGARTCVGGVLALTAVARHSGTGPADYLLLVQERSGAVVNVTGRLAVIPKAFHQPLSEPGREVKLSMTLLREFEEELLGRQDLEQRDSDTTSTRVAPLHPDGLSEPLAWLKARSADEAYRMECTGFGLNMVTGNYEFASLIVIDDDDWWRNFGYMLQMNWEADRVHCLSSLDTDGLATLAADPRWSNEGLFAFLQGLRRLTELDRAGRVAAPAITLES